MKLAALLVLFATPALADDYLAFQSPSGNIQCALMTGDYAFARCDMRDLTPSFTRPPADCDLDWGHSFSVDAQSRKGYLTCAGDTVADPAGIVLDYGKQISLGGFICSSEKTGMTCTNPAGHGFSVSKAKQRLF